MPPRPVAAPVPPPVVTVNVPDPLVVVPAVPLEGEAPPAPGLHLPPSSEWPTNWFNAWIPLETWSRFNHLDKPVRLPATARPTFQIRSTHRTVSVQVGSRTAHCDGLECWLNHAPQLINGAPYVHWLDARKTLQPLVSPFPVRNGHRPTVVIDPGHGGRDGGTRSCVNGDLEKTYTLDWARRLGPLLEAQGWKVVFTRTNDVDLPLTNRVAIAERARADLFLSLHFNSAEPNRALAGVETYCLTPTGMTSHLLREFEDDPASIFPNNAFDEQNVQIAFSLHQAVVRETGAVDRGVRRARFMTVLRGQNRPAVLIEAGYLSNPDEARRAATPAYRQQLARAVASALAGLSATAPAVDYSDSGTDTTPESASSLR